MASIFDRIGKADFLDLAARCGFSDLSQELLADYDLHAAAHRTSSISSGRCGDLERRWYASLDCNAPDYSVYSDPFYLCDIWLCWRLYSRKALMAIRAQHSMKTCSVVQHFGPVHAVLDLGCGFGFTTAALAEIFPFAKIIGTNLRESFQFTVAEQLGKRHRFAITENVAGVGPIDVVFASEYFEHIQTPLEHLYSVLTAANPRHLIIANGFNGRAIGHFHQYQYRGKHFPAKRMSQMFNETLRHLGFRKMETKLWNNRPSIWSRHVKTS